MYTCKFEPRSCQTGPSDVACVCLCFNLRAVLSLGPTPPPRPECEPAGPSHAQRVPGESRREIAQSDRQGDRCEDRPGSGEAPSPSRNHHSQEKRKAERREKRLAGKPAGGCLNVNSSWRRSIPAFVDLRLSSAVVATQPRTAGVVSPKADLKKKTTPPTTKSPFGNGTSQLYRFYLLGLKSCPNFTRESEASGSRA